MIVNIKTLTIDLILISNSLIDLRYCSKKLIIGEAVWKKKTVAFLLRKKWMHVIIICLRAQAFHLLRHNYFTSQSGYTNKIQFLPPITIACFETKEKYREIIPTDEGSYWISLLLDVLLCSQYEWGSQVLKESTAVDSRLAPSSFSN